MPCWWCEIASCEIGWGFSGVRMRTLQKKRLIKKGVRILKVLCSFQLWKDTFLLLLFIALQIGRVDRGEAGLCLKRVDRASQRMAKWLGGCCLVAYTTVLPMEPAVSGEAVRTALPTSFQMLGDFQAWHSARPFPNFNSFPIPGKDALASLKKQTSFAYSAEKTPTFLLLSVLPCRTTKCHWRE